MTIRNAAPIVDATEMKMRRLMVVIILIFVIAQIFMPWFSDGTSVSMFITSLFDGGIGKWLPKLFVTLAYYGIIGGLFLISSFMVFMCLVYCFGGLFLVWKNFSFK